ncbi:hypothetical protein COHA_004223 [Chlorella ohadii]|uniref:Exosome complex component RRP45 n=1 Tax=Chlorella ohadii TaxID=2649997 RepID=A0AAD5DQS4_9CHLO|nr:hypothetical protein COHA_004223 [Chlorella ohadii]
MAGAFAALQRDADAALSNNERDFILKALKEGQRIDGRAPFELRPARFQFALDDSSCTVLLGRTRVMAVVTATLDAPYADRHAEGSLRFNVEFSPMASPAFEPGRPGEDAIEVARLVERGMRESRAVDLESLVVLAGRKVWHLRVDLHVLDHQGNLIDACGLAALAALMAFRRPDVTVGGGDDGQAITVHSPEVREPRPLSLHHLPLPITFALWEDGELMVVDPSLKEEAAAAGRFTVTQNAFGELCALQKVDGCGLTPPQLMRCVRMATQKVEELTGLIRKALEAHEVARVQARIRRQPGAAGPAAAALGGAALGGRAVTVLRSDQLQPAVAAAGKGGGGAVALDLDALPDSVRSMLQQAAAQPDGAASMSEDESGSSSSEEEEESELEGDEGQEGEAESSSGAEEEGDAAEGDAEMQQIADALAAAQQPQQQQQQQDAAAAGRQQAAPASGERSAKPGSKKRRGAATKEGLEDELAAIADMIASAGGAPVGDDSGGLAAAVKKQRSKQSGTGGGSRGKPPRRS